MWPKFCSLENFMCLAECADMLLGLFDHRLLGNDMDYVIKKKGRRI